MNLIRYLFSGKQQPFHKQLLNNYFQRIKLQKIGCLPSTYRYELSQLIKNVAQPNLIVAQISSILFQNQEISIIMKLITILQVAVIQCSYNSQCIQQFINLHKCQLQLTKQLNWFQQFTNNYVSYMSHLSSLSDTYKRALAYSQNPNNRKSVILTDIFLIINQVSIILPSGIITCNTIGRYYSSIYPEFVDLYIIIHYELNLLYKYMQFSISEFIDNYRQHSCKQLRCLMQTIPEIELVSDKLEDLLMNKYFKGKTPLKKILLQQQLIAEVIYYLQYEQGNNMRSITSPKNKTNNQSDQKNDKKLSPLMNNKTKNNSNNISNSQTKTQTIVNLPKRIILRSPNNYALKIQCQQ